LAQTVLLIDDDETLRLMVGQLLEEEGYDVIVAGDGLEALEQLENMRPDLILLDLVMPNMEGYALEGELRRRGLRPAIPVVLLTAGADADDEMEKVGAAGCLKKPFELDTLLQTVAETVRAQTPE